MIKRSKINKKINQKSIKNPPKIDLEAVLGRLDNHFVLGAVLGALREKLRGAS